MKPAKNFNNSLLLIGYYCWSQKLVDYVQLKSLTKPIWVGLTDGPLDILIMERIIIAENDIHRIREVTNWSIFVLEISKNVNGPKTAIKQAIQMWYISRRVWVDRNLLSNPGLKK